MPLNNSYGFQLNKADISWPGKTGRSLTGGWPRNQDLAEQNVGSQERYQPVFSAETQLLEELVEAGQITPVQRAMVMHDQASTGMTIAEILIARGWL